MHDSIEWRNDYLKRTAWKMTMKEVCRGVKISDQ